MVCVFVNLLQITRQQVNHFSSAKTIPKCELVLRWGENTPPVLLNHQVDLLGARDHNYFLIHVNPGRLLAVTAFVLRLSTQILLLAVLQWERA